MATTPDGLFFAEYRADNERAVTLALVHGSMDRSTSYFRLRSCLSEFDVIAYDRRGYHRSLGARPPTGDLFRHARDLISLLRGRSAVVFGHSFGADVALAAASLRPDTVAAVMAYEPPMPWAPWWPKRSAGSSALASRSPGEAAENFMRSVLGDARWDRLSERTRSQRRAEGAALVAEMTSIRGAQPIDPASVSVPTVVARGTESHSRHRTSAEVMARLVPGAELVEIEGAGHDAHRTHPDAVAAILRAVVRRSGLDPGS